MGRIAFEKRVREARLLSPLSNFNVDVQLIEFRKDPLTGRWCRMNVRRAARVKQVVGGAGVVEDILPGIAEKSRKSCFFCPENLEERTPMFPGDLIPEGRIKVGSACLFPNLFAFGEHHAVGIFSEDHHLGLNQFSPKLVADCIRACLVYFKRVSDKYPDINYCFINWNHLFPAGASIVHPHVQVIADHKPTCQLEELIKNSKEYYDRRGSNYWSDLVAAERETGLRLIGQTGSVTWLTSYAPQANNEVLGVFSDLSTVNKMDESHVEGLSAGLSKILNAYHEVGVSSFNMTTFSAPSDLDMKYYSLNVKLASRPKPEVFYTSDVGFMERLHYETVIETKPEDVAEKLRMYF